MWKLIVKTAMAMKTLSRRVMHLVAIAALLAMPHALQAQRDAAPGAQGDSVRVRLVDVDLRAAIQSLAPYIDRPVIFAGVAGDAK